MQDPVKKLADLLACTCCRSRLVYDPCGQRFSCTTCGRIFPIINGIPCFVPTEQEHFSEVPAEERDTFLAMKKMAYSGSSFIGRLYNHYHRYATDKRREQGEGLVTIDVGFGIGEHYPFVTAKEIADVAFIGTDMDRFKLEHVHTAHPDIPVLQADALNQPFANNSVDIVQMLAVLEHFTLQQLHGALDEAVRILKPGRVLIACYPAEGGAMLRFCQRIMHAFLKLKTGFDLESETVHHHCVGAETIRRTLGGRSDLQRLDSQFYPFGIRSVGVSLFVNEIYRKR